MVDGSEIEVTLVIWTSFDLDPFQGRLLVHVSIILYKNHDFRVDVQSSLEQMRQNYQKSCTLRKIYT